MKNSAGNATFSEAATYHYNKIQFPKIRAVALSRSRKYCKHNARKINTVKSVPCIRAKGTFHILLIDNEQLERRVICDTLIQHLNFSVEYFEAWSGDIAVQAIGNEEIDLIIYVDNVADMNGLEILNRFNKKFGNQNIPIIKILNAGAESAGARVMKMGAHYYLFKDDAGHYFDILATLVARIFADQTALRHYACSLPHRAIPAFDAKWKARRLFQKANFRIFVLTGKMKKLQQVISTDVPRVRSICRRSVQFGPTPGCGRVA
jgi:PleD family two-component response regulator